MLSPLMNRLLNVNEIYLSLQGESTFAGLPCVFVRLTGCNLRCSYCDTAYAFFEGSKIGFEAILERVQELSNPYQDARSSHGGRLPLVELTGGEPLLQAGSADLMRELCDRGFTVLVETSGAWDARTLDPRIHRIFDMKCPSSGESHRNFIENLSDLRPTDEIKFVIATREDYDWASERIREHRLAGKCSLLFSWAAPLAEAQRHASLKPFPQTHHPISRLELVESIVRDALPVRFQVQMHKVIWAPDQKGV